MIRQPLDHAIFAIDGDRRITVWNAGAEALFGLLEADAIGQSGDVVFTSEDRAASVPAEEMHMALRNGCATGERLHVRQDGTRLWGTGTLMRLDGADGATPGFMKIVHDHTGSRQAEAALQHSQAELLLALQEKEAARAALEIGDRAKNRFLAVLSHELRNPLASVLSAADLLARPDTSDHDRAQSALVVRRQARIMKILLDDLLDVSRLTVGRIELNMRDAELTHVIELALETARPAIETSRHRLHVRLPAEPVWMEIDPIRISQVLLNLLTNAAQYTPPGGQLALIVQRDDQGVSVAVTDNGEGIEPAEIERMFELYSQGPPVQYRLNEGLGIGLTLARSIIELHHGSLTAASEGLGRGARFMVRLPLRQPSAERELAESSPTGSPQQEPPAPVVAALRILVADDNTDAAWALSRLLQKAGHQTTMVESGAQALEQVDLQAPDVAILDIGMPDINGMEVARRLRARPDGDRLVLIALTGWGGDHNRRLILESGFDEHITKPVDLPELQRVLAALTAAAPRS